MSRLTYDLLSVEGIKEVLEQISSACKLLQIDFFLVGAVARNVWLVSNNESATGTKDIDVGVCIPSIEKYKALQSFLIKNYDYHLSSENEFCLLTKDQKQVDLLPFGEIENTNFVEKNALFEIQPDGFQESFLNRKAIKIGEEHYETCSIPGVVILKLIAFDDRPEIRIKDIKDINAICKYYPEIETEHIWENHSDLYEEEIEHLQVGIIVLGREMGKIIGANKKLKNRVISILEKGVHYKSDMLKHMIEDSFTESIEMKKQIALNLLEGLATDTVV